ncbi:hypothetical protein MSG28_011659 [Choristoneura fumiferana]|uniref:Uncharacterized protein n=1 Tax=Choristoneura fumiferana TaxID=7141 RepID=A0ACC0KL83_CHOFU|nr:hypothetical protein MSG28_011659 [Choristoneura fumiferana]
MESSILGEFNREQDAFIKGQAGGGGAATAPWMYPVAVAIMAEDSNLEKMRFDLVPKHYGGELLAELLLPPVADLPGQRGRRDEKSASESLIAKEKSSQESIDDAKQRIKTMKVDRENDDGKTT